MTVNNCVCKRQMDEPTLVELPNSHATLTVTALDARHIAGAVQYLFECAMGRILHTGDFRWDTSTADIPEALSREPIDYLILDNTYCNPKYHFPPRAEATAQVWQPPQPHTPHKTRSRPYRHIRKTWYSLYNSPWALG